MYKWSQIHGGHVYELHRGNAWAGTEESIRSMHAARVPVRAWCCLYITSRLKITHHSQQGGLILSRSRPHFLCSHWCYLGTEAYFIHGQSRIKGEHGSRLEAVVRRLHAVSLVPQSRLTTARPLSWGRAVLEKSRMMDAGTSESFCWQNTTQNIQQTKNIQETSWCW